MYHHYNIEYKIRALINNSKYRVCTSPAVTFADTCYPRLDSRQVDTFAKSTELRSVADGFSRWVYACSLVVNKDCIKQIGGFNEELQYAQDVDFIIRILLKYKILELPQTLVMRREHDESGIKMNQVAVEKENRHVLYKYINKYGICIISENLNSDKAKAKCYNSYAKYTDDKWDALTRLSYNKSKILWKSFINPAHYSNKCIIGIVSRLLLIPKILQNSMKALKYKIITGIKSYP